MSPEMILFITLIIYVLGMIFAITFDKRFVLFTSLLWIVPIYQVDNEIIHIFSIAMMLIHVIIPVSDIIKKEDEFN